MNERIKLRVLATSLGQRVGIPHTFNPDLTIREALLAVAFALCRIFLGSLLFAVWGVCAWSTWEAVHSPVLRILALLPIVLLFVVSQLGLMIAINTLATRAAARAG